MARRTAERLEVAPPRVIAATRIRWPPCHFVRVVHSIQAGGAEPKEYSRPGGGSVVVDFLMGAKARESLSSEGRDHQSVRDAAARAEEAVRALRAVGEDGVAVALRYVRLLRDFTGLQRPE